MFDVLLRKALLLLILFSGLPLFVSAVAGLLVSVLQAATQIQEQSISFAVKLVSVSLCLWLLISLYAGECAEFFREAAGYMVLLGKMP